MADSTRKYNNIQEEVDWLVENHTVGTNDGTNWSTITINGVTKAIPTGGGSSKTITDIIVDVPDCEAVTVETGDITVETSGAVQYDDSTEDNINFSYHLPIEAGTNVTITENEDNTAFVINATGGSGTTNFNDLTNRPSYNGSTMTGSTSIPEVKTAIWDAKQSALSFESPLYNTNNTVELSLGSGLENDEGQLIVDETVIQHKLTAGTNITISGNTISAAGGTTYTAGDGIDDTEFASNVIAVALENDGGLEFSESNSNLQVDFTAVQQKLTSGTNIKTITVGSTATSLLGSGTITGLQAQMSVEVLGSSDT